MLSPLIHLSSSLGDCPCQIGTGQCKHRVGHDGMHYCNTYIDGANITMEVLWSDEWLPLSREAMIQLNNTGGSFVDA